MSESPLSAVILAAGLGTRMRSATPKVLHRLCGRPMIDLVLDACAGAGLERVLTVVAASQPEVAEHVRTRSEVVVQEEQKGTGHALLQVGAERLEAAGDVLVLNADAPLLRSETIAAVVAAHRSGGAPATLATVHDPARTDGRVLRTAAGDLERIVEHRDATAEARKTGEINVGLYCFDGRALAGALSRLHPDNSAGELYLTDVFDHLRPARIVRLPDPEEAVGVNDRVDLARAEAGLRRRVLEDLMRQGVSVRDPATTFVDLDVRVGRDTVLEPFTVLRGETVIGERCRVGPFVWMEDSRLGDGADCGPFSRLRAGVTVAEDVHIGSFAELVRTSVGARSRVGHVSYLGDATLGEDVNIGAGTITANYDGVGKNATVIED
ncbi:MAG: bifunctional UDP-N-acetylglucosamine diphosphorylase/glucosamine-1-phosphate N-acetyltransferase GlmU, partial [Candidatus Dormibacteraeota bacterium]|nr:bifunctional UDP-N-acetylglucosamine diphosphorylase/glucosamine-1-phosphate N-acetyltransferase GlmU [Candidatus Dormibacteraeota bacterium]